MTLPSIQSKQGTIGLIELDLAPKLASLIGLNLELQENVAVIEKLLTSMGEISSHHLTGLIVDPIYSFAVTKKKGQAGVLTRLTILQDETDPLAVPSLFPNYGLEEMRNNYNMAALELFYHPQEDNALKKKQLLAEIYDYCDYLDIHLLLKIIVYTPAGQEPSQENFQKSQLQAIQEICRTADVVALQYPLDPLAAATITAELDIPWVLSSQGQSYEEYKQELRVSLENGATGFCIGTPLWRELKNMKLEDKSPDLEKINQFIETTFKDRLIELMRISTEIVKNNS